MEAIFLFNGIFVKMSGLFWRKNLSEGGISRKMRALDFLNLVSRVLKIKTPKNF